MDILKRHNYQKNNQVEDLLKNVRDYSPIASMTYWEMREGMYGRQVRDGKDGRERIERNQKKVSWDTGVRDNKNMRGIYANNSRIG